MTFSPPVFYNGFDVNGQVITGSGTPVNSTDVPNKAYVDALSQGKQWHDSVRVATTSNVTFSAPGTAVFDGITLSNGDRMILTGQTTTSQNGPAIFNGSGVPLTRPADWASASVKTNIGAFFPVGEGTISHDTVAYLTTDGAITVDTTATSWSFMNIAGITYTASSTGGLSLTANAFAVKLPSTPGLIADSTGLYITKASAQAVGLTAKYAVDSPSLTAGTPATITHGLGTTDVQILCYRKSDGLYLPPGALGETQTGSNTVTIQSATTQSASAFRIVIIG